MPYFTYDTSVIIARNLSAFQKVPQSFLMSAIVLLELIGSSGDATERKRYEQLFRQYQKDILLFVPIDED